MCSGGLGFPGVPWVFRLVGSGSGARSGAVQDGQGGEGADEEGDPGVVAGVAEPLLASAAGEGCGDGVESVAEPFGFPAAGVGVGEGEELHPGGQLGGEGDDGAPDLVLGEAVQGQVRQAGVFGEPDPVLAEGPAAVP